MASDMLCVFTSLVILLHFVEGSRWSWGEDHQIVFTLDNGTQYALHELQALYPDALHRFSSELALAEDRRVCELILSSEGNVIEAVAAVFPPDLEVCEDHIVDKGDVLVEGECGHGYFTEYACSICSTDHTAAMDEIDWQEVAEDLAFERYREDQLMARYEGE